MYVSKVHNINTIAVKALLNHGGGAFTFGYCIRGLIRTGAYSQINSKGRILSFFSSNTTYFKDLTYNFRSQIHKFDKVLSKFV